MMNTEPTTRDLVYLAGLLHDERVLQLAVTNAQLASVKQWMNSGDSDWIKPLLRLADDYASGTEGSSNPISKPSTVRLESIFPNLHHSNKSASAYYFKMEPVSLSTGFFPRQIPAQADKKEIDAIWQALTTAIQHQVDLPTNLFADALLYNLEKYAATIPCNRAQLPDVALFDHLKSTAAIALCLFDYLVEKKKLSSVNISGDEMPLLLVGGDLSGIQSFIYDIIGRSAAKNLKGRSFYLQLIVDSIVQHLLQGLQLRQANIVYSSGGGFYLLAPNTTFVQETLPKLQQEIAAKIREEQGIRLFLAIDQQPIAQNLVFRQQINEVWAGLTERLAAQKKRRFSQTLANVDYDYFFKPSEVGGESRGSRDAVTSEEFTEGEKKYPLGLDDEDVNLHVRKSTFEQVRLGRTLRERLQYIIKTENPITDWEPDERTFGIVTSRYFAPLALKSHYYFIGDKHLDKLKTIAQRGGVNNLLIQRVNATDSSGFMLNGKNHVYGFVFYGGNNIPRWENEDAKYFDDLAGPERLNFKRLGILRMDVDNLGFLFKNGFSSGKRTFSRYSTVSRQLDYFFKGYLNVIRESDEDFKNYTFILYAGGDDLFIVGKWDVILRFAERIQQEFTAWTCQSPGLGISGGVAIVPTKFPIAKAADQSADEEKRAKNHYLKNQAGSVLVEKNSISLFGTPLGWGTNWKLNNGLSEWQIVTELKDDLKRHIGNEKNIPKALINKISTLYTMKQEQEKTGQNPSWRWLSAYDLGRARERAKSKEAQAFFDQIKTDLFTNTTYKGKKLTGTHYGFLDLLHVAARWAELEMRSDDKQTD